MALGVAASTATSPVELWRVNNARSDWPRGAAHPGRQPDPPRRRGALANAFAGSQYRGLAAATERQTGRTFESLIGTYEPNVQALARGARALITEIFPDGEESVDPKGPYVTYGYGSGYKDVVYYLTVNKHGVKLGVAQGAELPDPKGLLEGAGKSHRHVVIATAGDLRKPGVKPLLRAALAARSKTRSLA